MSALQKMGFEILYVLNQLLHKELLSFLLHHLFTHRKLVINQIAFVPDLLSFINLYHRCCCCRINIIMHYLNIFDLNHLCFLSDILSNYLHCLLFLALTFFHFISFSNDCVNYTSCNDITTCSSTLMHPFTHLCFYGLSHWIFWQGYTTTRIEFSSFFVIHMGICFTNKRLKDWI